MTRLSPRPVVTSVASLMVVVAMSALMAQSKPPLHISGLRTGEVMLDKGGLSIPITVNFEIADGVVTNTIVFIQIEGSKGVGNTCGSGEGAGSKSGTLSCTWKDAKFKVPKNKKALPFKLSMVTPYGDASNTLEGTITLPSHQ